MFQRNKILDPVAQGIGTESAGVDTMAEIGQLAQHVSLASDALC